MSEQLCNMWVGYHYADDVSGWVFFFHRLFCRTCREHHKAELLKVAHN